MQQLTREGGEGADSLLFFHDYKDTLNLKTNLLLCVIFQQALVLCENVYLCRKAHLFQASCFVLN